ncbi:MAG: FemAB family PEP-CTERM system-associated protein [Pseudomonadota bacterium]
MTLDDNECKPKIESLDLKGLQAQLNDLKIKKGICSRKIGLAKKNSEPVDKFIDEVRRYTNEIKKVQIQIDNNSNKKTFDKPEVKSLKIELPSQFKSQSFFESLSEISVNTCLNMDKWDAYIFNNANSSVYHSASIKTVIETTFGLNCIYLIAEDKAGDIKGVLPLVELNSKLFGHFFVSLPFFNYGGILADNKEAEKKLFIKAKELSKHYDTSHIEYRHCHENNDFPCRNDKISMLLNLPDTKEQLWQNIGSKLRAQIKKPEKLGAEIKIGREELVNDFYKVFSHNMRDLGTPVYSKSLFSNMLKFNKRSNIAIVYLNSKPVSAGFILGWRNTLEIPWASTLRSANKYSSNMMLYWGILEFSIEQGYKVFDFGRSGKDSNTYRFKKQWGAKEHKLHWHYSLPEGQKLPQINPNNPKYKLFIYLWKKLPITIANIIGPYIVKNLP